MPAGSISSRSLCRLAQRPAVVTIPSRCHDELVTTAPVASSTFDTSRVHSLTRPNMVSVGTIIWLASELMFFAGLFAMYFTARARSTVGWPQPPTHLDLPYALVFTIILVLSSVTCQFGVFSAEQGNVYGLRRWFTITFVMGLIFVLGQANEYRILVTEHDTSISSSTYGSVFYLTTGFHALHVIGGLIAFIFLLIRSTMGRFTPAQATAAIVVSFHR